MQWEMHWQQVRWFHLKKWFICSCLRVIFKICCITQKKKNHSKEFSFFQRMTFALPTCTLLWLFFFTQSISQNLYSYFVQGIFSFYLKAKYFHNKQEMELGKQINVYFQSMFYLKCSPFFSFFFIFCINKSPSCKHEQTFLLQLKKKKF